MRMTITLCTGFPGRVFRLIFLRLHSNQPSPSMMPATYARSLEVMVLTIHFPLLFEQDSLGPLFFSLALQSFYSRPEVRGNCLP